MHNQILGYGILPALKGRDFLAGMRGYYLKKEAGTMEPWGKQH